MFFLIRILGLVLLALYFTACATVFPDKDPLVEARERALQNYDFSHPRYDSIREIAKKEAARKYPIEDTIRVRKLPNGDFQIEF